MTRALANLILQKLSVVAPIGVLPPGSERSFRSVQRDGELTVLADGDSLTVLIGKESFSLLRITPEIALRLGWFLLWHWWIRGTWCGLKLRLWFWAIGVKLDEAVREQEHERQAKAASVGRT